MHEQTSRGAEAADEPADHLPHRLRPRQQLRRPGQGGGAGGPSPRHLGGPHSRLRPQAVAEGAFLLQQAVAPFPPAAVHVAVVDPGVGGGRRALAVQAGGTFWVGPDNGILSAALPDEARPATGSGAALTPLPPDVTAVELTERGYRRATVSATFHGRDIFAPAAAYLALGVPLPAFGPPVHAIHAFPPFRAKRRPDGIIIARVVTVDHFGNAITDCRAADLPPNRFVALVGQARIHGPARTYAEADGPTALVGSGGYLEIAVPNGDAAATLAITVGDTVIVEPE
ncbi:MAG: SAM-dependent chlorinase/fluorinase [Dehalococcoidia bacterium]